MSLKEFLIKLAIVDPEKGCWFIPNEKKKDTYRHRSFHGESVGLHILFAIAFYGYDRDDGVKREICHKCNVKACFNPDHIYIGNRNSNLMDMWRSKRISENHCIRGHVYDLNKKHCNKCITAIRRQKYKNYQDVCTLRDMELDSKKVM